MQLALSIFLVAAFQLELCMFGPLRNFASNTARIYRLQVLNCEGCTFNEYVGPVGY